MSRVVRLSQLIIAASVFLALAGCASAPSGTEVYGWQTGAGGDAVTVNEAPHPAASFALASVGGSGFTYQAYAGEAPRTPEPHYVFRGEGASATFDAQ